MILASDAHATSLIALFFVLTAPTAIGSIAIALGGRSTDRRPDTSRAVAGLAQQLVLGCVLAITFRERWWTWDTREVTDAFTAIVTGVFAYASYRALHAVLARARRMLGREAPVDVRAIVRSLGRFWPRTHLGRALVVSTLALNGVTEEIVTRGIFVHAVGSAAGSLAVGVAVGLAVNVVLHVYQGVRSLPGHAVFFALTVLVLESRAGLLAAITLHVIADLAHADGRPALTGARAWRRWQQSRRVRAA